MFEVMLGRHPLDTERDMNAGNGLFGSLNQGVNGLRLGVLNSTERAVVDNEILSLYDAACEELRSLGAELVTFTGPMDFADLTTATATIIGSEGYFHHGALFESEDLPIDPDVRPRILLGQSKSARDYIEALMQRRQDQADFLESLRGIDALLTPTVPTPAVALDEVDQSSTPAHFTRAGNYLGLCGLSVPMGLTSGRLPGGLQVLARGLDVFEKHKPRILLDLGCGAGSETPILAASLGARIIAVDHDTAALAAAPPNPNIFYVRADATRLPFAESTIDACYSLSLIHISEPTRRTPI